MEGLHKFLKTLSNEVIDLKKKVAKESSSRKFYRSFKRTHQSSPPSPPLAQFMLLKKMIKKRRRRRKKFRKLKKKLKNNMCMKLMVFRITFFLFLKVKKKRCFLLQLEIKALLVHHL